MGWPSISTVPSLASQSLATRAASVVFPQPVGPTTASVDPAGIFRLMSERTACGPLPFDLPAPGDPLAGGREGGEAKVRARKSISPTGGEAFGRVALRSSILNRKSTRLNSSHGYISYAGLCLEKKTEETVHLLL